MSQKQLIDQLVKKVQGYVVNSARYNIQTDVHADIWYPLADNMSDKQTSVLIACYIKNFVNLLLGIGVY